MQHVVKRHGRKERFDERKLYGSCYAACMACRIHEKGCEDIASGVTKVVKKWLSKRKAVDSTQILEVAHKELKKLHKEAAYMYRTHREID